MTENGKDKRLATRFGDQVQLVFEILHLSKKPPQKGFRKLMRSVTRGSEPADAEAVQLTLGRDHEWRLHQMAAMKAVAKVVRLMMMSEDASFCGVGWQGIADYVISTGIFDVINLLLRVKVPPSVTDVDSSSKPEDSWESVYFHCLEICGNIIASLATCDTANITKPFIDAILTNHGFLDQVATRALDSSRPFSTCFAVYILRYCCAHSYTAASKIATRKGLLPKLCHYAHKNNTVKLVLDWLKGGVEQFEFDMMADRPQGLLPIYNGVHYIAKPYEEMTKPEQRHIALTWAFTLQYFSLQLLGALCSADSDAKQTLASDPTLLKSCTRWLSAPITNNRTATSLKETLIILSSLCTDEAICHRLLSSYNFIKHLENGVFHSSLNHVSLYFQICTKIASHPGMLQNKICSVETFTRSAAIHMYCFNYELRLSVFAYLTCVVKTPAGIRHLLKYFGPHHIHYYPLYFSNNVRYLDMGVEDFLPRYQRHVRKAYDDAYRQFQIHLRKTPDLDEKQAERLKEEGNAKVQTKDYTGAIEKYTEALIICPPLMVQGNQASWHILPVTLYSNRAQCHLHLGNYDKAVKDCDKAVARCLGAASPFNEKDTNIKHAKIFRKALYRRARALYALDELYRAILDITVCAEGDRADDIFKALQDKIRIQFRQKHGTEPIPYCDKCGSGIGRKLKRCGNCTALYCSRECQLQAWEKCHKNNCKDFVKTEQEEGDDD